MSEGEEKPVQREVFSVGSEEVISSILLGGRRV